MRHNATVVHHPTKKNISPIWLSHYLASYVSPVSSQLRFPNIVQGAGSLMSFSTGLPILLMIPMPYLPRCSALLSLLCFCVRRHRTSPATHVPIRYVINFCQDLGSDRWCSTDQGPPSRIPPRPSRHTGDVNDVAAVRKGTGLQGFGLAEPPNLASSPGSPDLQYTKAWPSYPAKPCHF